MLSLIVSAKVKYIPSLLSGLMTSARSTHVVMIDLSRLNTGMTELPVTSNAPALNDADGAIVTLLELN